jgi:hypothetical protein
MQVNKLELARGVEDDDRIDLMAFDDLPMPSEYSENYQYHVTATFPGNRSAGPIASAKPMKNYTDHSVCVVQ